jgi:lycopene beta-cyclase
MQSAMSHRAPWPPQSRPHYDVILVGGGLANALIAWRLAMRRPGLQMLLLESGPDILGDHTWSFHEPDLSQEARDWIDPLVEHRWVDQEVRFPGQTRRLRASYCSLTTASLGAGLRSLPRLDIATGIEVDRVGADHVVLAQGTRIAGSCVLDGRGFRDSPHMVLGFQKFVGLELEIEGGHGLARPVIMDAAVPQQDGYRFVYLLPFDQGRVLIEDTRYSDGAELDRAAINEAIRQYVALRGWRVRRTVRSEQGVLPIALAFDVDAFWRDLPAEGGVPVGLRAGLFHATTGFSLPLAVQVAELIAAAPDLSTRAVLPQVRALARELAGRQKFFRFLNRMLFEGCPPQLRWRVMQRFYTLPEPLIERFYAGRLSLLDRARIVTGKPPIPITRGLACLGEARLLHRARQPSPATVARHEPRHAGAA